MQFCQKMKPFSQKIVAVANVLVLTCLFFLFALEQPKKQKKSQIWYNSTQNPKNALDKIIGTLNLIFGSTPFGKNNWNQSLPVTMNEFLTPLYWNFGPLFFSVLLEDPWPLVETQLSDTGHYVAPQNSLVIIRFHDTVHTVKASSARSSKATPKHLWTSTMFDCRDCVLFFEGLISFSVNSAMMSFTKKLYFCLF